MSPNRGLCCSDVYVLRLVVLAWIVCGGVGTALASGSPAPAPVSPAAFVLTSPAVKDGGDLPKEFTGDGAAATLPLEWSGVPKGTRSFAVIMHHIAPDQTKWYWILYNIPPDVTSLPKNVQGVGTLGNNSVNRRLEYAPPHSKGPGAKTYIYTVYALSAPPTVTVPPEEVNRDILLAAMKDLILGSAELHVTYTRFPEPDRTGALQGDPSLPSATRGAGGTGGISTPWIPVVAGSIAAVLFLLVGPRLLKASWPRRPWAGGTVLTLLLCSHFCLLLVYFEPAIGTPDASGYCVQTRLLATEGQTWFARESPLQYVNHHWLNTGADHYFSQYPPGLSAISAGIFRVAGPTAALLVNPVLASLTLLGVFLLCRLWIGPGWGLLATAVMAVNP
ncbi:MAG: YbhB/YbcL family Raf kinase inhibitor-like protein, partial [Phycisphaerae bacterium]